MQYRSSGFADMPPVVKNLLIINGIVFMISLYVPNASDQIQEIYAYGALFPIQTGFFRVWQPITYMFMHGGWSHIIFNMLTLWMFGRILENFWGSKRFLQFYLICGIVAAGAHLLTTDQASAVGASGAIMGLMAAFAYLFPNTELYLFFVPIPIKAKYVIPGLMALDVFGVISPTRDGIAHWAHLGGALAGLLIVIAWNKSKGNRSNFY